MVISVPSILSPILQCPDALVDRPAEAHSALGCAVSEQGLQMAASLLEAVSEAKPQDQDQEEKGCASGPLQTIGEEVLWWPVEACVGSIKGTKNLTLVYLLLGDLCSQVLDGPKLSDRSVLRCGGLTRLTKNGVYVAFLRLSAVLDSFLCSLTAESLSATGPPFSVCNFLLLSAMKPCVSSMLLLCCGSSSPRLHEQPSGYDCLVSNVSNLLRLLSLSSATSSVDSVLYGEEVRERALIFILHFARFPSLLFVPVFFFFFFFRFVFFCRSCNQLIVV